MTTTLLVAAYTMWVWYYPDVGWEPDPQNYATKEECMAAIEPWSNHVRGTALEAMDNDKEADKRWPYCLLSSESPNVPEPTFAHMERPEMPLGGNIAEQQTRKPNYAQGLLATIADQTLPGRFLLAPGIPRRTGTRPAADDPTGRRIDLPAGPAMALRLHPNDPVKAGALIYHPEIPTEFGIPEALNTTHFMPPTYPRGLGQYPPPVMDERGNLLGSPNYNPEDRRNVYVPLGEEPPSSFRK
jgi:hypothetical protein